LCSSYGRDNKGRFRGINVAEGYDWITRIDDLGPGEWTCWRIAAGTVKRDCNSSEWRIRVRGEFRHGERCDLAGHTGQRRHRVIRERIQLSHHLVGVERHRLLSQLNLGAIENVAYHRQLAHAIVEVKDVSKVGHGLT